MRRALATLAALFVGWRVYCTLRGRHEPVRHLLGGQKCADCGKAAADRAGLGFEGSSDVSPGVGTFYSRDGAGGLAETTRTERWGS